MKIDRRIVVIGAGVIGLSTAIRLLRSGYLVDIIAREFPPDTTSNVAAAFWYPYRVGPEDRASVWAEFTYRELGKLYHNANSGVRPATMREVFKSKASDPWFRDLLKGYSKCEPKDIPEGFVDGFEIDTYLIETPRYMNYLLQTCEALGANKRQETVQSMDSMVGSYDLAINCTGVWARHLVDDDAVYPIRGQVVVTDRLDSLPDTILTWDAGELPAYIVPRSEDCILGGTAQEGNWALEPSTETAKGIRARCQTLHPLVSSMKSVADKVGLRPGRKVVRLERDNSLLKLPVIHNYGHGGSGFTLSWGCAEEVLQLVL